MSAPDDRATLLGLWDALGLGGDVAGIALDATITARTFAARATELSAPAASAPARPPLATLPRLSIARPSLDGDGAPAEHGSGAPDLTIMGLLGEGGMGRVHRARQRSLARDVAVKTVRDEIEDRATVEALLHEAVITGSLEHPGIIPVHALGCDDRGRPILVMKRVEGVTWSDLLHDEAQPAWRDIAPEPDDRRDAHLEILMKVCHALELAHSRRIVHRDIKPENVMVGRFGEVYLVDWGIAAPIAAEGERRGKEPLVGTPVYLAPEMLGQAGSRIDERTDVYLLGATLHEILTGRPRHGGATMEEVLLAAMRSAPASFDASVPSELAAIAHRATSRDPAHRHPSVLAFRQAIAAYLRHKGSIALSCQALAQLAELRDPLACSGGDGEAERARRAHRLMTECRFGLMQALRAWPENAAAREGLTACLDAMIEREIAHENVQGARDLASELPARRPDLEARIEAVEALHRERRARDDDARQALRDQDLRISARPRGVFLAAVGVTTLAVSYVAGRKVEASALSSNDLVLFAGALLAGLLASVAVFRRHLLSNLVGRRLISLVVLALLAMLVHRTIGMLRGAAPLEVLTTDLLIMAVIAASAALTMVRRLWPIAATLGAGALLAGYDARLAPVAFAATSLLSIGLGALLWRVAPRVEPG